MSKTIYTEKPRPTSAVQGPHRTTCTTKLVIRSKITPQNVKYT